MMGRMRALRSQRYGTRRLQAGDDFYVRDRQMARAMRAVGLAEDAPDDDADKPAVPRRRGRPPKAAAVEPEPVAEPKPEPKPEPKDEPVVGPPLRGPEPEQESAEAGELDDLTRDELIELAEQRGVELPAGYIPKDELVRRVGATESTSA